jgi:hypothetical protein
MLSINLFDVNAYYHILKILFIWLDVYGKLLMERCNERGIDTAHVDELEMMMKLDKDSCGP